MVTLSAQLDRTTIQEQVFDILRQLLAELGSHRALQSVKGSAHLDRDLGLGSLERVELMVRLDSAFHTRLADHVVAEADTVDDLVAAVIAAVSQAGETMPDAIEDSATEADSTDGMLKRAATQEAPGNVAAHLSAPHISSGVVPPFTCPERSPRRAAQTTHPRIEAAETLQEILRYRGTADAATPHIYLREDTSAGSAQVPVSGAGQVPSTSSAQAATTTITFGELYQRAQGVARELARRGIRPGDTVAIMLPTSREFFFTFAGVLLAAAIPVPMYPPVRADRIEEYAARQSAILQNAEARLLVTFHEAQAVARMLKPRVPSLAGVVNASHLTDGESSAQKEPNTDTLQLHRPRKDDIALLQYTSGSTGEPKGAVLTHANLLANIRAMVEAIEARPDDVAVSWLPLYHDMGLIGAWLMPLYFGLPVVILSPLAFLTRPERWLWAIHEHRGTLSAAPNFAYELCVRKIADRDIEGLDLSSWRLATNGAEPVSPDTMRRFTERFAPYGLRRDVMVPVYGLAEASLAVTVPPLGTPPRVDYLDRVTFEREGRAIPVASVVDDPGSNNANVVSFVSVGRPVPNHEVRIVDANGRDVPERVEGALWFRGPSTTRGYYRNPEATQALFPEGVEAGWVDSGDRGYWADGEIFITGRVKDIIIKAGRNIYPQEVEDMAGRAEGVRKGCVVAFGVTDESSATERLIVVAETREQDSSRRARIAQAITEEITTALGLPPDAVELLAPHSIPKTSSGKLRRQETRKLYLSGQLGVRQPPAWLQIAKLSVGGVARAARQHLSHAFEVLYGLYASTMFGIWIVPSWFLVLLAPGRRAAARITATALRLYMALVGCRIRVRGRENLPSDGARVFVANHTSYFDVLVLMAALGVDYRFVAKMEVRSMPFIGTFMRKLGHVAFDRNDPQARLRQAEEIEQFLRRGESVFVFPEGTFTPHEGVRPFQLGAFKAAVTTRRPICPVALRGSRQFLRDETYLPRPTSVTLTICPPLEPARSTSPSDWQEMVRLRDAAREAIARHAGEQPL